ncbi:MAG: YraN family protein [Pseudomonadota bacterium]
MESPRQRGRTGTRPRTGTSRALGRKAENRALQWLLRRGLTLLARNFHCRHGELDLVMRDRDLIVFVEVRCRAGRSLSRATTTVDRHKQQRLARAALFFLAQHAEFGDCSTRFDVVGFDGNPDKGVDVDWIRDAFHPEF